MEKKKCERDCCHDPADRMLNVVTKLIRRQDEMLLAMDLILDAILQIGTEGDDAGLDDLALARKIIANAKCDQ